MTRFYQNLCETFLWLSPDHGSTSGAKECERRSTPMDTSYQAPAVPRCWELIGYLTLAILIFLGILLQGFLIGALLFAGAGWAADAHATLGLVMLTLALLLPLAGWLARLPGRLTILSAVLSALTLIQVILPNLSDSLPFAAALPPPTPCCSLG
jgi:hypothetical protein